MNHTVLPENQVPGPDQLGTPVGAAVHCPLPVFRGAPNALTSDLCQVLKDAGCPLTHPVQERLDFEALLADLSAAFIGMPTDRIDTHIESALERLVGFLGMDRGSLAELQTDKKQLAITHSHHVPGAPPNPRFILDEQLPWYTMTIHKGEPLRLCTIPDDLPPEATAERAYCMQLGMKAHVMIPLTVMGSVVGAIGFASFRASHPWPDDLIRRLRLVGEIFTNALARKRADEELRERERALRRSRESLRNLAARLLHAQEDERRRVAREMHDDWSQRLALLSIDVAAVQTHIGAPDVALPLLRAMQERLVSLSEDVHDLSRQLHPSILDDLGLVEALRSECAGFSRREGIAVDYRPDAVPRTLAEGVALCLYRVAQEALRNLAKHAAVNEARVTLGTVGRELVLRVRDEGVGFDPTEAHARPSLGLNGMEERVRFIRAKFTVSSVPGHGTTVEVRVPLAQGDS